MRVLIPRNKEGDGRVFDAAIAKLFWPLVDKKKKNTRLAAIVVKIGPLLIQGLAVHADHVMKLCYCQQRQTCEQLANS